MSDTTTDQSVPSKEIKVHDPQLYWVAIYLVALEYGGPEEGGWWYEVGVLVTDARAYAEIGLPPVVYFRREEAEAMRLRMELRLNETLNVGRRPLSSTLSTGRYYAEIHETELPSHYPDVPPTYE